MKKAIPLAILVLFGLSVIASPALAFGDCAGKSKHSTKRITEQKPPAPTSG